MKAKAKTATIATPGALKPKKVHQPVPMEEKPAVQLLADMVGIMGNRKELLDKIVKKFPRSHDGHKMFDQYLRQTKKFIKELMDELSAYGDGLGDADHNNAYNDYWKASLVKWDTFNQHRLILFWRALETILRDIYKQMQSVNTLPPSFATLLEKQLAELELFRASKQA